MKRALYQIKQIRAETLTREDGRNERWVIEQVHDRILWHCLFSEIEYGGASIEIGPEQGYKSVLFNRAMLVYGSVVQVAPDSIGRTRPREPPLVHFRKHQV